MPEPLPLTYADMVTRAANRLMNTQRELKESESYYDATFRPETIGVSVPDKMRVLRAKIGWGRMYLDAIEERLDLEGFRLADRERERKKPAPVMPYDPTKPIEAPEPEPPSEAELTVTRLLDWWQANDLDEQSGLAHLDALIYGRSYITVSAPGPEDLDQDTPIIRVESPLNMHVDIDPRTHKVTRAVRLFEDEEDNDRKWATLYLPDETVFLRMVGGHWVSDPDFPPVVHNLGQVPVVPLINRERLADHCGRSEITPELRSFTDAASRTMMNMQAAAELMAVPQRILFGVDAASLAPNGTKAEALNAYMAQILAISNEAGSAQQFDAAELRNYVDALQELAKHVASYTGLPPQYLSFASDNPASAEAIRSAESRLVKKCERKSRMFGGAWEETMRLATLIMDGSIPPEMRRLQSIWRDPSTPTYAAKADGVFKLFNGGSGVIPKRRARIDMGYTDEEIRQMEEWDEDDRQEMTRLADILGRSAAYRTDNTGDESPKGDKSASSESPNKSGSGTNKAADG